MKRLALIVLIFLVVITYISSLGNDFVSDDRAGILFNKEISSLSSVAIRPEGSFRFLSLFAVSRLFGKVPFWFHLMNILFHIGVVIVAYKIILRLVDRRTAFFAACLFAVHPLQSEAVAWISGGPYTQYSFFLLLSLLYYVISDKGHKGFLLSQFFFLLSLTSSSGAIVLPVLIFWYAITFQDIRKVYREVVSYFLISSFWVAVYIFKIGSRLTDLGESFYQKPQLLNPLQQIPIAITSYLELMVWPANLTIYHSEMTFSFFEYLARLVIFVGFLGLLAYSFWRNRKVFFWLSFFIITLLPTLTPLGISWIVAERYAYLGSLGAYTVVAMFVSRIQKRKAIVYWVFGIIIFSLSLRTVIRIRDWRNEDTLWIATAKTSPSSPNTHNNLGDVFSRHREFDKAIVEFKKAIQLNPHYADAYHNLANAYLMMDKKDEAARNYQEAIKINPKLCPSYQNLATIFFLEGKYDLAQSTLIEALRLEPNSFELHNNLGILYMQTGQKELARSEFKKTLELKPSHLNAKKLLLRLEGQE